MMLKSVEKLRKKLEEDTAGDFVFTTYPEQHGFRAGATIENYEAIADRIDAEHQKALDEWKAEHGQMWLKGYSECHAELLEGNETLASDLERCGWIRLPKDADGEYIHVGDVLTDGEYKFKVFELAAFGDGSWSIRNEDGDAWAACDVTRHHEPTVEDVLRDMHAKLDEVTALYVGEAIDSDERDSDEARIFAEYAQRLQLREVEP